jgi:hypothetical protein
MQTEFVTAKHTLTDAEKQALGQEMADRTAEADRLRDELDSLKKDFNSRIRIAEITARSCGEKIRNGYEMREVECTVEVDPKTRLVRYIRTDTGEVARTRPAEQSDLQQPLPG